MSFRSSYWSVHTLGVDLKTCGCTSSSSARVCARFFEENFNRCTWHIQKRSTKCWRKRSNLALGASASTNYKSLITNQTDSNSGLKKSGDNAGLTSGLFLCTLSAYLHNGNSNTTHQSRNLWSQSRTAFAAHAGIGDRTWSSLSCLKFATGQDWFCWSCWSCCVCVISHVFNVFAIAFVAVSWHFYILINGSCFDSIAVPQTQRPSKWSKYSDDVKLLGSSRNTQVPSAVCSCILLSSLHSHAFLSFPSCLISFNFIACISPHPILSILLNPLSTYPIRPDP